MAKKTSSTTHTKGTSGHSVVYIVGDSPLVEEYANLCADKGYSVVVDWNESPKPAPKFEGTVKVSSTTARNTAVALELTIADKEHKKKNLVTLDKALAATAPILTNSVTVAATEQATWISGKHRLVGIGALPSFSQQRIVETAPTVHTPKETVEVVQRFMQSLGKEIEVVQDRVGMVLPRILCQLVNEATFVVQEDVATPQDVDTAMKLGTNYPLGPIEWGGKIGFKHVYSVLSAIENDLSEDRYRISPLLKMLAHTGEWWKKQ
ncbi:MAG: 3-hydroxyacyl-CoA dehydrogenase family protein [Ignavibacteriae bacterium]|nr:3-hydroxyacyl-CoA dehydrogenase family protein [Ignavibacteriota bacterium]